MRSGFRKFPLIAACVLYFAGSHAGARLDDSASPRGVIRGPQMLSEYGHPIDQYMPGLPAPQRAIVDFGRVEYRLATAAFVGRSARIYFVIPALVPGLRTPRGLRVAWRGEGRFAAGSGHPGDKVLVWSGIVQEAQMQETLALRFEFELPELLPQSARGISLESYFEIEVSP